MLAASNQTPLSVPPPIPGDGPALAPAFKVKFAHKAIVFLACVISLSWFFEGYRDVNKDASLVSFAILIGGTLSTLAFLGVWCYWIYFEEKSKGTLKKRIKLFESINSKLSEQGCRKAGKEEGGHCG